MPKCVALQVEAGRPGKDGEHSVGPVYRNMLAKDGFPPLEPGLNTSWDIFRVASEKYPNNRMLGWREFVNGKVFGGHDSDIESPAKNQGLTSKRDLHVGGDIRYSNHAIPIKKPEKSRQEVDINVPTHESTLSMGDILSSMEPGITFQVPRVELNLGKSPSKVNGTASQAKRSSFWERNGLRKNLPLDSADSSGEEELAIQRLEMAKNDLRSRIAKEAKGNAILQASLERRKQALHERRLALEQDVTRLQEQLQAERDLRAALEVGLSMSSGQFSSSRSMDSKTRAELEEIALAEADVARLKQKVAELHHQLNQQRLHHYGSISETCPRFQNVQNPNNQQKIPSQDFDMTLAFCNQEKKQRNEESSSGADWRTGKPLVLPSASKQLSRKLSTDSTSLSDSKSIEASASNSAEVSSSLPFAKFTEGSDYQKQTVASSALVELTTRLDFFKERRSQLMEQLHNIDLGPSSQGLVYKTSPPWEP